LYRQLPLTYSVPPLLDRGFFRLGGCAAMSFLSAEP
jgi:hypothetical protein